MMGMKPGNQIHEKLALATDAPGVYLMKDAAEEIIYIGKARNLKKRLAAYFKKSEPLDPKIGILVQKISDFETVITRTEKEALILESNLIKRHRPRYNVVLKDDKRYPSLRIDLNEKYPNFSIVRKIGQDGALYFGPFASAQAVRETLRTINKTFKLRKCKAKDFKTRTRPCLHCQMEGCLAPCCLDVDPDLYREQVKEAIMFLRGRTPSLIRKIKKQMTAAAASQDFGRAARLRDKSSWESAQPITTTSARLKSNSRSQRTLKTETFSPLPASRNAPSLRCFLCGAVFSADPAITILRKSSPPMPK